MPRPLLPLLLAIAPIACGDITSEVAIGFERPRDDAPLGAVDNITVTLSPEGFTEQFSVDGPDDALQFELEPDDVSRTLSVFMAQGETLIAYGRTPAFTYAGAAGAGVVVFLGYPGTVATLDREFALPDASTVVAASPGRGAVALGSDGSSVFLDAYTLRLITIAPFPEPAPAADDGIFVGDDSGSVTRIATAQTLTATRYVYGTDTWLTVSEEDMPARPGSALWYDPSQARAFVAGGGDQTTMLAVDVATEDTAEPAFSELEVSIDGPRQGAALIGWPGADGSQLIVFGGDDPALPLVLDVGTGSGYEQTAEPWTGARCTTLDETRVLCAGGTLDGTPTADGVEIDVSTDPWSVSRLPDLLPAAMREVLWLEEDGAVYAQGESRLVRFDRATLERTEPPGGPVRARGGGAALMPNGTTLIAGGEDADGSASAVWQLFSPSLP